MLEFKTLDLSDIKTMRNYFNLSRNRACDNTVGGTFIWRDYFNMEYAAYKTNFIFKGKFQDGTTVFAMPLGKNTGEITDSLKQIELYCYANKIPPVICMATDEDVEIIETAYKNTDKIFESDWSDYVYKASDLADLAGKKYHGQKNHVNYFKRTFQNYEIKSINAGNIGDARIFLNEYNNAHNKTSPALIEESKKVFEIFDHYELYGQTGIALYIGAAVAGFSIGETSGDTLFVHIEKADFQYRGAYPMIVNEFVKHNINMNENIIYVNREDDAGDENLRLSKMSYHPHMIIKKYTVTIKI